MHGQIDASGRAECFLHISLFLCYSLPENAPKCSEVTKYVLDLGRVHCLADLMTTSGHGQKIVTGR